MRRVLGFIPLAPIVLASLALGCDALVRDFAGRARRWHAELLDEIEKNK